MKPVNLQGDAWQMTMFHLIAIAIMLCLTLPPTINSTLSFGGLEPTVAVMLVYQIWLPFQGLLTLGGFLGTFPFILLFLVLTGIFFALIIMIPYAATNGTFEPGVTKAAILATLFILIISGLHLTRIKWSVSWSTNGFLVQVFLVLLSLKAYYSTSLLDSWYSYFDCLIYVVMAVALTVIVTLFLTKMFASRRVMGQMSSLIVNLKELANMTIDDISGVNQVTEETTWQKSLSSTSLFSVCNRELRYAQNQIDLYSKPHFGISSRYQTIFHRLLCIKSVLLSCFWVTSSRKRLIDSNLALIKLPLEFAFDQLSQGVSFQSTLTESEASKGYQGLIYAMNQIPVDFNQNLMVRDARRRFLAIISELSVCYHVLFPKLNVLSFPSDLMNPIPFEIPEYVPSGMTKRSLTTLNQWMVKLGTRPWQLALTLQFFVPVIIGTIFVMIPVINQTFDNHATWIVLSMIIIADISLSGNVIESGVLRVIGTLLGAAVSYITIALAFAINGLSFENTPGKLIVVGIISWMFLSISTYFFWTPGRWSRIWFTAGVAYCVIVLFPLEGETGPPWLSGAYRVAGVIVGVVIQVICSMILFPVSVKQQLKEKALSCLNVMEKMCREVSKVAESGIVDDVSLQRLDDLNVMASLAVMTMPVLKQAINIEKLPITKQIRSLFGKKPAQHNVEMVGKRLGHIREFLSSGIIILRNLSMYSNQASKASFQALVSYFNAYAHVLEDLEHGLIQSNTTCNIFSSLDELYNAFLPFQNASEISVNYAFYGILHLRDFLNTMPHDFPQDEVKILMDASMKLSWIDKVIPKDLS